MFLLLLATLYVSRIIINILGINDFGIYSVVSGLVIMLSFVNNAMSIGIQRFLNYSLGENDINDIKLTFSTSINIQLLIGIIVIIIGETIGLWFLNSGLNIPSDRVEAANWIYQFSLISFFITIVRVPYNALIVSHEKMNIYALLSIVEVVFQLISAIIIKYIPIDKLVVYGSSILFVNIILFILYFTYCRAKYSESRYSWNFDIKKFKTILSFSAWNLLGQLAQLATIQGTNIVINMFFNVAINAAIGIANQVNSAISSFVHNFQTAFRPQIIKSYAIGEFVAMNKLIIQASKFSFFLIYLVSAPILLNIDQILNLWLKTVPTYSTIFSELIIWSSFFEAIGMPLTISIFASGKIKHYQICVSSILIMNIIISIIFLSIDFEPEIVFYIRIVLSILVLSIRLFFAKKLSRTSIQEFIYQALKPISIILTLSIPILYIIKNSNYVDLTFLNQIIVTIILEFFIALLILSIGLTKSEKTIVKSIIKKYTLIRIKN